MTDAFLHRTWIDIDLDRLIANYRTARSLTQSTVTCVLKSNAYGHGAARVAQALQADGCRSFAVSCAREGFQLRKAGIQGEILVMGLTEEDALPESIREGLTLTAASAEDLQLMEGICAEEHLQVAVHLKADTGFHRLGIACTEEAAAKIGTVARGLHYVRLEGLYSHLGLINRERDEMQYQQLMTIKTLLEQQGVHVQDVHLCDSIGLVRYPQWHMSRVRVGALLFGVRPSRSQHMPFECLETLTFRTTVAQVHHVDAGEIVGYGDDQILTRPSVIATLCAGYGDGYPRHLSNGRGQVMIQGHRAPVIGLVCMDQMMVDVTDLPEVHPGNVADLLGGGIGYGEMADWAETNRNECLSILSARPVRVYWQKGQVVTVTDDMLQERRDFA